MLTYISGRRSSLDTAAWLTPRILGAARVASNGEALDLFEEFRRHDVLLHHPYDSYDPVLSFIQSACRRRIRVLLIKQTLYRTSEHSLIVPSLMAAAAPEGSHGGGGIEGAVR